MVSNGTSSALNSEQDLGSIPTAQGGLSRLAIARLKSAGVPVVPLLRRVGLTPEVIADPGERLIVRSQITLLDEAAIALQDDCLGFTLARDFDPREIGLLYYVMASSQTLGDALKRVARYSQITRYREGNGLIIGLSYSGVPRHSDRYQIEFCTRKALSRIGAEIPHPFAQYVEGQDPRPRSPASLALANLHKIRRYGGCTHPARRLSGPPLECMRECTHFAKAEQPRNLGYLQLGVIKVSICQIPPQLLKYFSEVQPFVRKPSGQRPLAHSQTASNVVHHHPSMRKQRRYRVLNSRA